MDDTDPISRVRDLLRDGGGGDPLHTAIAEALDQAGRFAIQRQHGRAVELLTELSRLLPEYPDIRRRLALALGGWAELIMCWADQLAVFPPAAILDRIECILARATKIDPDLPDPFWDLAVVTARFRTNYEPAAGYLGRAKVLGYAHPMIPALERLIADRGASVASPPCPPSSSVARLRSLVLEMLEQTTHVWGWGPLDDPGERAADPSPGAVPSLGDYRRRGLEILAADRPATSQLLDVLHTADAIGGDHGELILDLLRRVADGYDDPDFLDTATDLHLRMLARMSRSILAQARTDPATRRKSIKTAQRGLAIVEQTRALVKPDTHAELLLARGQVWADQRDHRVIAALKDYRRALALKREAGNEPDVRRLCALLWKRIDWELGRVRMPTLIGGVGEALEALDVMNELAAELDDPERARHVSLALAETCRITGNRRRAEQVLRELLTTADISEELSVAARFELASVLSESGRAAEAVRLQEELLADQTVTARHADLGTLWSNYGNSLRLLGRLQGAAAAYDRAWELLPEQERAPPEGRMPVAGFRILTLQADAAFRLGERERGFELLRRAEALVPQRLPDQELHLAQIKAPWLFASHEFTAAEESVHRGRNALSYLLSNGPSLDVWESMLADSHRLDALAVRAPLQQRDGDGAASERALIAAEAAKGRIAAWLRHWYAPEAARRALDPERQSEALVTVRRWLAAAPGRCIVSLFGSEEGLGVFAIRGGDGAVRGTWLQDVVYDHLRLDLFDPWEHAVVNALESNNPRARVVASALTDYLLDAVGALLWRGAPELADGGKELVILPHRLFRNLPLAFTRLPTGARLCDAFHAVTISPTLADLATCIDRSPPALIEPRAFVDSRGDLAFARLEGTIAVEGDRLVAGDGATVEALRSALAEDTGLLLSAHGDFDEEDPWRSAILCADGRLELLDLLDGQTRLGDQAIVLGVCEAGKSRRSISDEPFGFPTLLLHAGAPLVVAPSWKVDDFASFLFLTRSFDDFTGGVAPAAVLGRTAAWLRQLTAADALAYFDATLERLPTADTRIASARGEADRRIEAVRRWLGALPRDERPFRSPLDWAAFQATGCPIPPTTATKGAIA